jgi:hypothetical protein
VRSGEDSKTSVLHVGVVQVDEDRDHRVLLVREVVVVLNINFHSSYFMENCPKKGRQFQKVMDKFVYLRNGLAFGSFSGDAADT